MEKHSIVDQTVFVLNSIESVPHVIELLQAIEAAVGKHPSLFKSHLQTSLYELALGKTKDHFVSSQARETLAEVLRHHPERCKNVVLALCDVFGTDSDAPSQRADALLLIEQLLLKCPGSTSEQRLGATLFDCAFTGTHDEAKFAQLLFCKFGLHHPELVRAIIDEQFRISPMNKPLRFIFSSPATKPRRPKYKLAITSALQKIALGD